MNFPVPQNFTFHLGYGLAAFFLGVATVFAHGDPQSEIQRSLAAHDRAVHIHDHWIRDPFIFLDADGWYYLTGTTLKTETDGVIGIPAWRSRDLASWEKLPRLWAIKDSAWMPETHGGRHAVPETLVWAPELRRMGERWVLVHTSNGAGSNLLISESQDVLGPYSEPMGASFGRRHDPFIFMDGNDPWLVWACTKIQRLKRDFTEFIGETIDIGPSNRKMGHEGAALYKIGDKYVLFGTAWSTDQMRKGTYNLYYCTADQIEGPYSERRFAGRFLGHGTPFKDKEGRWWCTAFYNANVPVLSPEQAQTQDLSDTAYSINKQGTTLVPLAVELINGGVWISAKDPAYASPGPEEVQQF